ncbi:MAG: hypothetical protein LQ343_004936 [Gyalolechia ehrenbergii]|nr:MAG: hypothetical protein LQ343_004936 [Gyalolechia ehrenbergii]
MTLHSDPGCSMNGKDCQGSQGCSIDAGVYGANINSAGGAVYALEWTSEGMSVWGWSGGGAPADATGDSPDPSDWGNPTGSFPSGSSCEVDTFFKDQQIVFDTTFCGVWAGDVWPDDPKCSSLAATCEAYVQNNPSAFKDTYWTINSLKVYTNGDGSTSSRSTGTSGTGDTVDNAASADSAPASSATANSGSANSVAPSPAPVNSVAPIPGTVNPPPANSVGVGISTSTAAQPVANPVPTAAVSPAGGWGGRVRGGRGGRGGPPKKIKRRIRGQHMKHLLIETSDQRYDEQGQSVILEAGVPELGEELQRV